MTTETKGSLFWKCVEYSYYIFFALFPFVDYSSFLYSGTATRSFNLIVFAALLGIAFAVWLFSKKRSVYVIKSIPLGALTLYFISLIVSGVVGLSFSTTFWSVATRMTGIWYLLSLALFMVMLWVIISDQEKQRRLILCTVLSTALYSVLDLMSNDGFGWIYHSALNDGFTFGNTSFAAMYIFGAFLLSLYYLLQSQSKKWWMYVLPILLVINPNILNKNIWTGDFSSLIGLAQASSFAVWLSLIALMAIWGVSKIKGQRTRERTAYGIFIVGVVGVACAVYSLVSPTGALHNAYLSRSTAARPLVWNLSEQAIAERPLLGFGADNFERVFEMHYDNRLLEDVYGSEAWFDRAHNVVIDELVDNGIVGTTLYFLVYAIVILSLMYVTLRSEEKRDRLFAAVLIVYFTLHIAELQTAFDTSISYPLLAFLFVSACVLYYRTRSQDKPHLLVELAIPMRYGLAVIVFVFSVWSLVGGVWPLLRAELANGAIRTVGTPDKRLPYYSQLFGSIDPQSFLWRTVTDFERAVSMNPSVMQKPDVSKGLTEELALFETSYKEYIKNNPSAFRARLNLADVLIYQNLFGVNKLSEAQKVLDEAITLVPQAPQPYWMKSVAYLYMGKFADARLYAKKAVTLNPNISLSQDVSNYIESEIKTFPIVDLFFFKQI